MNTEIRKLKTIFLAFVVGVFMSFTTVASATPDDGLGPDDQPPSWPNIFEALLVDWDSAKTVAQNLVESSGVVKAARALVDDDNTTIIVKVLGGKVGIGGNPEDGFLLYVHGSLWADNLEGDEAVFNSLEVKTENITLQDGSIDGSAIKDDSIGSDQLKADSVTGDQIQDGSVESADLAENSVSSDNIINGTIQGYDDNNNEAGDIAEDAITSYELADNAVSSEHIENYSIKIEDLDENIVFDWDMFPTGSLVTNILPLWNGSSFVSSSVSEQTDFIVVSKLFKFASYTNSASLPTCASALIGSVAFNSEEEKLLLCTSEGWQEIGQGGGSDFAIENQGAWCGYHGINSGTETSVKEALYQCAGYDPQVSCPEGYTQVYFRTLQDDNDTIADEVYTCVYSDLNKTFLGTDVQGAWCGYQGVNEGYGDSVYTNKIKCGSNNPKTSCPTGYEQVVLTFTAIDGDLLEDTIYSCLKTSAAAVDYNNGWYGWSGQNVKYNSVYDGIIENNNLDPEAACAEGYLRAYFSTTAYEIDEDPDFGYFCVKKPVEQTCGNSILEGTEVCDDGNTTAGDGCASDCLSMDLGYTCPEPGVACEPVAVCGNGQFESGEACDDGNTVSGDGCTADCRFIEGSNEPCTNCPSCCGNGELSLDEACDDGNTVGGDGCVADCSAIEPGWSCPVPGEPCHFNCGDGDIDAGEYCDDFDSQSGDGCSANCVVEPGWICPYEGEPCVPLCGNGTIEDDDNYKEECDDGNKKSGDGCSFRACEVEAGWECDTPGSPCTRLCGNSEIDVRDDYVETCDDGPDNKVSKDGCSYPYCQKEIGWECPTVGDTCVPIVECGDGILHNSLVVPEELREECDDGNKTSGDGCSYPNCEQEPGFDCLAEGMPCVDIATKQISSCEELQKIGYDADYPIDSDYALVAPIDCSMTNPTSDNFDTNGPWADGQGFKPLPAFGKIFDGQGYAIDGLYISRTTGPNGLFQQLSSGVNSEVKNLQLTNVNITGVSSTGGLAGASYSNISNVYVTGTISSTTSSNYIGGITGWLYGSMDNGYFKGTINSGSSYIGGLVGGMSKSAIINSTAIVSLPGTSGSYKGGLVGTVSYTSPPSSIQNSSAYVSLLEGNIRLGGLAGEGQYVNIYNGSAIVTALGYEYIGGLVGYGGGIIYNSNATAAILGYRYIGGLTGYNGTINNKNYANVSIIGSTYLGGLSGYGASSSQSYAIGSILGNSYLGGLVGYGGGAISNSYAKVDIKGMSYLGGLVGSHSANISGTGSSYAIGEIDSETDYAGGLIGGNINFSSGTNFWSSELSGQDTPYLSASTTNAQNLSAEAMKNIDNYVNAGWDVAVDTNVDGVWKQVSVNHYPCLSWQDDETCLPRNYRCGDGVVEGLEACDDTNNQNGDGCSADCLTVEDGYSCPYPGFPCITGVIEISSCSELQLIGKDSNYPLYGNYELVDNIDCSATNPTNGGTGFNSIGSSVPFFGTFDGKNNSISNVYFAGSSTNSAGIFKNILFAEVKNLKLKDVTVNNASTNTNNSSGGIAYNTTGSTISNCFVSVSSVGSSGGYYFAPIAYTADYSKILNSSASINMEKAFNQLAGIVHSASNTKIDSCSSNIELSSGTNLGGIINNGTNTSISNSTAIVNLGTGSYVGGIANVFYSGIIEDSSAVVNVESGTSNDYIGGIISATGNNSSTIPVKIIDTHANIDINGRNYIGGIIGSSYNTYYNTYFEITDSSVHGYINGGTHLGGLIGSNSYRNSSSTYNKISGSYADVAINGSNYLGGLVGHNQYYVNISNSYSAGSLYGEQYIGGIMGYNTNAGTLLNNNYTLASATYDRYGGSLIGASSVLINLDSNFIYKRNPDVEVPICGIEDYCTGGTNVLIEQLKNQTVFENAGWDYSTPIWKQENIDPPREFSPCLAWQDDDTCYSVDNLQCGNGKLEDLEACDDMNNSSGDGCSSECLVEDGWYCYQQDDDAHKGVTRCTKATLIETCQGLQDINNNLSSDYELVTNLDCSGTATWNGGAGFEPIGNLDNPFLGDFDGRGHEISGIKIDRKDENRVGLFAATEGSTIKTVGLKDVNITGLSHVGGLVGGAGISTVITECFVTGYVGGANVASSTQIGGLIGSGSAASINDSYVIVNVAGNNYVGAIAGSVGTVARVYSDSTVGGTVTSFVGSLAGYAPSLTTSYWNEEKNTIKACGNNTCLATGLTTEQMFNLSNFGSLSSVLWKIPKSSSSPCLMWQKDENCPGYITTPVSIDSCQELQLIGNDENYPLNGRYILSDNIDCTDTVNWNDGAGFEPIAAFRGFFEGNNKAINGLTINTASNHVGLFSSLENAEVSDLALTNVNITGGYYTAALAGNVTNNTVINNVYSTGVVQGTSYVAGLVGAQSQSEISNSYSEVNVTGEASASVQVAGLVAYANSSEISNSYATGEVSGYQTVGGLVGFITSSKIDNCNFSGKVTGRYNYAGGLVAYALSSSIKNSNSTAEVTNTYHYAGGLVGLASGSTISDSYNTGTVTNKGLYTGGLAGMATNSTTISDSYNTGAVTNTYTGNDSDTGGLVGLASGSTISDSYNTGTVTGKTNNVGGLVGYNGTSYSEISDSYNTGAVTGASYVGGLAGMNYSSAIFNSYNAAVVTSTVATGNPYVAGLVGYNHTSSTISGSYNTGKVVAIGIYAAALAGYQFVGAIVENSYYNTETSNQTLVCPGNGTCTATGLTSVEMAIKTSFSNWVFSPSVDAPWQMPTGASSPCLKWQELATCL